MKNNMVHYSSLFMMGLLIIINGPDVDSFSLDFSDIREILGFSREIFIGSLESLNYIRTHGRENDELNFPFIKRTEQRLLSKITDIDHRLKNMEDQIDQKAADIVDVIMTELPKHQELTETLNELDRYLENVDDLYQTFINYSNSSVANYTEYTRLNFAKKCVDTGSDSVPRILKSIHRLIVSKSFVKFKQNLFVQLANTAPKEAEARICNEKQSPQQLLYNLYSIIVLTELRGYAMMQFSYTVIHANEKETNNFTAERDETYNDLKSRIQESLRAVKVAMAFAPRDLWRCDPSKHEKGETYTELTQLFQGYIVNEVDLNPSKTCRENCGYYSYTKVHGCYDNLYCSQQRRCNGKVLNCHYIDSDMWICPSENRDRRYEYIEYENGKMFGKKGTCTRSTSKVDSWWRWLFWHCSYCMCYCDDFNSSSDRYFNLRETTSDVMNNKVITGMRLTKVNQVVHIQIQEGILSERAVIKNSSISWKPVENYSRTDAGISNERDYHTLTWEKRAIDLDDLIASEEHLLTGVRFRMVGAHLNFEIRVTPFNFTTGLLIKPQEKSTWLSNDNTDFNDDGKRTEFVLNKPDIPTRAGASTKPDSKTNQFLNFGPTDLEKDAAQTTIPFLDIQPVETNPPFPLAGAGVFHKGRSGSGGYIALKVMTYDFTKHLRAELPVSPVLSGQNEIPADREF